MSGTPDFAPNATYFDGTAPVRRPVRAALRERAVVAEDAAGSEVLDWPLARTRRLREDRPGLMRLKDPEGGDARLAIADANLIARIEAAAPALAPPAFGLVRSVLPAAAAAALSTLFLYGVIRTAPLLAEPAAKATPPAVEERLGRNAFETITDDWAPCEADDDVDDAIADLARRLGADETGADVRVTLVRAGFPNAFALPGGRILVTGELIDAMESPDEFAGVLAHEIGHVKERHGLQVFIGRIGLGVVAQLFAGGADLLTLSATEIAALSYSRDFEREADAFAVEALKTAGIDTGGLAALFERLRDDSPARAKAPAWLSTHPGESERAESAKAAGAPGAPAMAPDVWARLKEVCAPPPQNEDENAPPAEPSGEAG